LDTKTFEQLVCLRDWFDTEQHQQHNLNEATTSDEFMTVTYEDSDGIIENDPRYMNPYY
jgi:hypothetical protein